MKPWEKALNKFLESWKNRKEVIGALVCGSYVTGNPSKHSDIDLHIILKKGTKWRERGNKIIDGILIEYFANPAKNHEEYAKEDIKQRRKVNPHMFSTGKILFDKTGEVKELIHDSKKYMLKKYPKLNKIQIELSKYHLWDMYDNLEEVFETDAKEFFFVFYNDLKELFETYAKFLQFDSIPAYKSRCFLVNKKDKKKYCINDFPDKTFVKIYVNAMNLKDKAKMMKEYQKLTKYVLTKMGGFNIDGWKIRSSALYPYLLATASIKEDL